MKYYCAKYIRDVASEVSHICTDHRSYQNLIMTSTFDMKNQDVDSPITYNQIRISMT